MSRETGSGAHFRRSRDLWNERRNPYPVLTGKDRLAGFLQQRAVSRPPQYDGEQFYIPLELPLDAPPEDLSSISDTVTVLRATWTRKRFQKNGQVYQGWCVVIADQDESRLWTVSANIFQTWPQMFGEKVR